MILFSINNDLKYKQNSEKQSDLNEIIPYYAGAVYNNMPIKKM